jgi:hypothetical protein
MHQPTTATVACTLALTGLAPPPASASGSRVPVRIVHVSGPGGIDWGDAAIGAAAGAGLTLLGLGGALVVSQRHTHAIARPPRPGSDGGPPPHVSQTAHQRRDVE